MPEYGRCNLIRRLMFNVAHGQSYGKALLNCQCKKEENLSGYSDLSSKKGRLYERTVSHITCVVSSF